MARSWIHSMPGGYFDLAPLPLPHNLESAFSFEQVLLFDHSSLEPLGSTGRKGRKQIKIRAAKFGDLVTQAGHDQSTAGLAWGSPIILFKFQRGHDATSFLICLSGCWNGRRCRRTDAYPNAIFFDATRAYSVILYPTALRGSSLSELTDF